MYAPFDFICSSFSRERVFKRFSWSVFWLHQPFLAAMASLLRSRSLPSYRGSIVDMMIGPGVKLHVSTPAPIARCKPPRRPFRAVYWGTSDDIYGHNDGLDSDYVPTVVATSPAESLPPSPAGSFPPSPRHHPDEPSRTTYVPSIFSTTSEAPRTMSHVTSPNASPHSPRPTDDAPKTLSRTPSSSCDECDRLNQPPLS